MLSSTQKVVKDRLIQKLSEEPKSLIQLYGESGSGKSTILKALKKEVEEYENWNVFYIEGQTGHSEPYSTIKSILKKDRIEISGWGTSITSSIFPTITRLTTSFSLNFKPITKYNSELNFFINRLKKGINQNILIIADDLEKWDSSSKQFLLLLKEDKNKNDFNNKNIRIIFSAKAEKSSLLSDFFTVSSNKFEIQVPELLDIVEIINAMNYSDLNLRKKDLEYMRISTGGDLHLLKDWVNTYYFCGNSVFSSEKAILDMSSLLEYRLEMIGEQKLKLTNLLTTSSIFDDDFKLRELRHLCKEIEDIDDFVDLSCQKLFLKKSDELSFSSQTLKEWFYKKLDNKSPLLHEQYAEYLRIHKPENYLSRAMHFLKSESKKTKIKEILGLFFLAYIRNIEKSNIEDSQHIYRIIYSTLEKELPKELKKQLSILEHLTQAYEFYFQEDYQNALSELRKVSTGSLLFNAEIARLQLLFALMSDMNTHVVESQVKNLEQYLLPMKENEKEQWLQSAFALFSTYSNKLGDFEKSYELSQELLRFTAENLDNPLYEYVQNILKRKAFIFTSSPIAKTYISDSVEYFEQTSDYLQYYFALCNFAGILLVLGEYESAIRHLEKCIELIEEHDYIQFPSQQKIYNNLYLGVLFQNYLFSKQRTQNDLQQAVKSFESHISQEQSEKNAIMVINLINLYLIDQDFNNVYRLKTMLKEEILINNVDDFYNYYFSNIELIENILLNKWEEATMNLDYMKNNAPSFHTKNKTQFDYRHTALEKLIETQPTLTPLQLNDWVYDHSRKMDEAASFYSRLFLFSDLQFSSL